MKRTPGTYALYTTLGCLGYLLTGLGVILPQLRDELHANRAEVALYPAAFSAGLIIMGFLGAPVMRLFGRGSLVAALAATGTGALLLGSALSRYASGTGALLLGLGGAGLFFVVPLALRHRHPAHMAVALGEGHGFSSTASVIVPLVIGGAVSGGAGWRVGYLLPPVAVIAGLLATGLPRGLLAVDGFENELGVEGFENELAVMGSQSGLAPEKSRASARFLRCWLNVLLVVIAEFCMVFWSTDFLRTRRGLHFGVAAVTAALLVTGMAVGRALSGPAARLIPAQRLVLAGSAVTALAGFSVFWLLDSPVAAAAGLGVTGLGLALLYPITLAQAIEAWPEAQDLASARCALASGLAILTATLGLGALADRFGLNTAMLLMPAVLILFLLLQAAARVPETDPDT